ncbi:MAG TPA: response regulator [Bacteroidota bacterium]|nr:response regulator [Bacteroidota bacterium]
MLTKRLRVLILDDERSSAYLLKSSLNLAGFDAHYLESKVDGYDWILKHRPDLIISDIRSPDLDGLDLLKWLKANPDTAPIPFLFVTACCDLKTALEARRLGAADFISKPYVASELIKALQRIVNREDHPEQTGSETPLPAKVIEYFDWESLSELFRKFVSNWPGRINLIPTTEPWRIYFVFEYDQMLVGGLFIRPFEHGNLSQTHISSFSRWLDDRGLNAGIIMGFYQISEDLRRFAKISSIQIVPSATVVDLLSTSEPPVIPHLDLLIRENKQHKYVVQFIKKLWNELALFEGKRFPIVLSGDQAGSIVRKDITLSDVHDDGIEFTTIDSDLFATIRKPVIWRLMMRLIIHGKLEKSAFGLTSVETACLFPLLAHLPSLDVSDENLLLLRGPFAKEPLARKNGQSA